MGIRKYLVGAAARKNNMQTHVHEVLTVTEGPMGMTEEECHSHAIAGVTGQMIMMENGMHRHELRTNTSFYEDHFHNVESLSGPNIAVAEGEHVHYVEGQTSIIDEHRHGFKLTTNMASNPER